MTVPTAAAENILAKRDRVLGNPVTFGRLLAAVGKGEWTAQDASALRAEVEIRLAAHRIKCP